MTKIKVVGGSIFLVSIMLVILFTHISHQNKINSEFLDLINTQKAFTQEISKNIFYIHKNRDASTKQLDEAIKSFIERMNNKDVILEKVDSEHIKAKSREIVLLWNKFYLLVQDFRNKSRVTTAYSNIILEKVVNDIYNTNLSLVMAFDALIDLHQEELDKTLERYKELQYLLFGALVLLLIYLFTQLQTIIAFVQKFLHTSSKIIRSSSVKEVAFLETEQNSVDIAQASKNFNQLLTQIDDAVDHAGSSLEHASHSLEIVEEKIEDFLELISAMQEGESIDKVLAKKEDALIESLEELSSSAQKLKALKKDLDLLIHHKNIS